jgi:hypothetical protein
LPIKSGCKAYIDAKYIDKQHIVMTIKETGYFLFGLLYHDLEIPIEPYYTTTIN